MLLLLEYSIASDEELVRRVAAGETALFELLIRRHNGSLYKIARGFGFNHQDAEDLMQETHIAAYQHLEQFAGRAAYRTWVSKIMIHKCQYKASHGYDKNERPASDLISESSNPLLLNSGNMTPEDKSISKDFARVMEQALQRLPVGYRSVFLLREVEGFSVAETADLLDITTVNVKVRFNRAKALLQKELEQYYTSSGIYEFNLIYCDKVVHQVFRSIHRSDDESPA